MTMLLLVLDAAHTSDGDVAGHSSDAAGQRAAERRAVFSPDERHQRADHPCLFSRHVISSIERHWRTSSSSSQSMYSSSSSCSKFIPSLIFGSCEHRQRSDDCSRLPLSLRSLSSYRRVLFSPPLSPSLSVSLRLSRTLYRSHSMALPLPPPPAGSFGTSPLHGGRASQIRWNGTKDLGATLHCKFPAHINTKWHASVSLPWGPAGAQRLSEGAPHGGQNRTWLSGTTSGRIIVASFVAAPLCSRRPV